MWESAKLMKTQRAWEGKGERMPTWGEKGKGMARPGCGDAAWKLWERGAASVTQSPK